MLPVIILAGGLATRLRPLTENIPKALLDINGEPFIVHQLRLLRKQNIRQVVIAVGYLGERIQALIQDGAAFDMDVSFVYDGDPLLGTGGAIKQALPQLSEAFFVLYGDSYLPCDFLAVQEAFLQSQKLALMTVFRNEGCWDSSNVEYVAGEIKVYDKKNRTPTMHYIDYGLGVFHQRAFLDVPAKRFYDLADLYQRLLQQGQLAAAEVKQRFYEVGSWSGIDELTAYLQSQSS